MGMRDGVCLLAERGMGGVVYDAYPPLSSICDHIHPMPNPSQTISIPIPHGSHLLARCWAPHLMDFEMDSVLFLSESLAPSPSHSPSTLPTLSIPSPVCSLHSSLFAPLRDSSPHSIPSLLAPLRHFSPTLLTARSARSSLIIAFRSRSNAYPRPQNHSPNIRIR